MSENNRMRLLWAGFMAILAAGVGFAIRGGIFDNWGKEFGFTGAQLGAIGGAGFSGFCFGIIFGGLIVDKIGYGKLVALALICHILSAFVTFGASTPENAYNFLFWGMFIFAYANGTLEAVANPLVATLFPENRTHYLNILHASWPAGHGARLCGRLGAGRQNAGRLEDPARPLPHPYRALRDHVHGPEVPEIRSRRKGCQLRRACSSPSASSVPSSPATCLPISSATSSRPSLLTNAKVIGYAIGGMLLIAVGVMSKFSLGSILLFVLFVVHALVGAVELGTDGWIQNITGNLFTSEQGKYLFIWTSAIMFGLRFCAHWIENTLKLSPVGLLVVCAIIASVGLVLASGMQTFTVALVALGIYAVGKTFFWPTMLAVVGDRFPQSGAVAMSIMGGIGMLSAGLIGGPGLGYCKDRFAGEALTKADAALYSEYKAATPFLPQHRSPPSYGLDGTKLAAAKEAKEKTPQQKTVVEADQAGDRAHAESRRLHPRHHGRDLPPAAPLLQEHRRLQGREDRRGRVK
jgi:hypothetical protein